MSLDLHHIRELPGLREWLIADQWQDIFDKQTLQRSRAYTSEKMIRNISFEVDLQHKTAVLYGLIHGTSPVPYQAQIILSQTKDQWDVETTCSCPVEYKCKHTAALLSYVSSMIGSQAGGIPTLISPTLRDWLKEIETAAKSVMIETVAPVTKIENRFLAYCLEKQTSQFTTRYNFAMHVGTRQKDGSVRISNTRASADPSKPPNYMNREDMIITGLYHQRFRRLHLWNDMPFEGDGWEDILDAIHATGRLYFNPDTYHADNYQPVTSGQSLPVEATWELMPDGSARPVLRCAAPNIIILPTHPPRYLNLEAGTLGLLDGSLPANLLNAWQKGPAISANNIQLIAERLAAIPETKLPTPVAIETIARDASKPSPHLRIHVRKLGHAWNLQKFIVGEMSFSYLDSPLLTPLQKNLPQIHTAIIDNKRVVWPRDFKAEQKMASQFMKAGLIALSEVFPRGQLDTAGLYSCVPANPFPSPELAWIQLLESPGMRELRAAGWAIDLDPKAGLTAHDVVDFFPEIETETDHGIDWFRFDIAFEFNGKRVSLIPVIADAIRRDLPSADSPDLPDFLTLPCENPEDGFIRFPAKRLLEIVDQVRHLFHGGSNEGPIRIDRLAAAGVANGLALDTSATTRSLAALGHNLKNITSLPPAELPKKLRAELRDYQAEGYRWLQFLAANGLHGILADDMGLGKTVQTLAHLAAEREKKPGQPSLVIAPTSVVPNWESEASKFTPHLKVVTLQGKERSNDFRRIAKADIVLTSYPLLTRDFEALHKQQWHTVVLDEAQYIKNPKAISAQNACQLKSSHRICLSGTPMENHLGELWSLMRFLMPGFLSDEKTFNTQLRRPIERDRSADAQLALNRRVAPLILRRTKDQVAKELPEKTEIIHGIELTKKQTDLYESVRAAMDKRVRDAIAAKGLAKSHIIVLDALLKLRQICCHPQLLKMPAAQKVVDSAKLDFLTDELLPTLLEEGRRILLFSTFTSMLALIEKHLVAKKIDHLILTGQTQDRASLVKKFQTGEIPIFLISLKAGGTGLNLTAADTVIHYDPWWNPAAENQATDRAHRIGQTKPVFVHKLVCTGTIEDRILELQKHKAALVEALLSEETSKLKIDAETLSHLLSPLD